MADKRIIILAQDSESTNIVYNALNKKIGVLKVIIEEPESKRIFFKRRARRLGWLSVFGQLLFMIYQRTILQRITLSRRIQILEEFNLNNEAIPSGLVSRITSCNSAECRNLLKKLAPDLVIINGTRIISKKTIHAASCPMINVHAGITPKYRGVHGAYWALRNKEPELCGVSLHLIDEGIDTGEVLEQALIQPTYLDSFPTYPILQLAKGIELLDKQLPKLLDTSFQTKQPLTNESQLWYHPTIWDYLLHEVP